MLSAAEFETVEAGNGREGLELLRALGHVDLVLVDWNMPEMDGLEFIKAVRADPVFEGVTLMMVTTENEPANIARALMAGADEYATKPCTIDALRDRLALVGLPS
jgi:two-component system chemotaxis response regulator CheY